MEPLAARASDEWAGPEAQRGPARPRPPPHGWATRGTVRHGRENLRKDVFPLPFLIQLPAGKSLPRGPSAASVHFQSIGRPFGLTSPLRSPSPRLTRSPPLLSHHCDTCVQQGRIYYRPAKKGASDVYKARRYAFVGGSRAYPPSPHAGLVIAANRDGSVDGAPPSAFAFAPRGIKDMRARGACARSTLQVITTYLLSFCI